MKPTLSTYLAFFLLAAVWLAACTDNSPDAVAVESAPSSTKPDISVTAPATAAPTSAPTTAAPATSPIPTAVLADREAVAVFGEQAELNIVIGIVDGPTAAMWRDGKLTDLPFDSEEVDWSDGEFIYNYDWSDEENRLISSTASTLDGTVVCDADGPIHHVTRRSDDTLVMAVEQNYADRVDWNGEGEFAVPLNAVDCQTGSSQPIESIRYFGGPTESTFVERIAGRVFVGHGDAEGNADVLNEQGISVNGEDYAGYHTFNSDASVVMYGDMSLGSPHFSPVVIARDTRDATELWRTQFDLPFAWLSFMNGRAAVGFYDDVEAHFTGVGVIRRMKFLDTATGQELYDVPVGFDLIYAG